MSQNSNIPDYKDRSPQEIIAETIYFDSVGFIYRALSWLDIAKKSNNICALQYAALETRQAIEQLLFEEIVLFVGNKFTKRDYQKCKDNNTKLEKILRSLVPDYKKIAQFTQILMSPNPSAPKILVWDIRLLLKFKGKVSDYLHWSGEPKETFESSVWLKAGITTIKAATKYIWDNKTSGYSGIMRPEKMRFDIHLLWEQFKDNKIDLDTLRNKAPKY